MRKQRASLGESIDVRSQAAAVVRGAYAIGT